MKVTKSEKQPSKSTSKTVSPRSGLVKKCMNCGLTMPYDQHCECLLDIGDQIRKKLARHRQRQDFSQTEVPREKKRPSKRDAGTDGPKQGGLF